MIVRYQLFFLLLSFFINGQEILTEDLDLVTDSSSAVAASQENISVDSSPEPCNPIAYECKAIIPYVELSFGNIWSQYNETFD
jgi:hypothetical protein